MDVGLYAGSFDPVHLGHVALITAAAERLDQLVVVVAANGQKAGALFSVKERAETLTAACRHLPNVRVETHQGLLVDVAGQVGATVLVRSAGKEQADERRMAYLNGSGRLPTVLLPPDPVTACISSSHVRRLIARGAFDAVAGVVPCPVLEALDGRHGSEWSTVGT